MGLEINSYIYILRNSLSASPSIQSTLLPSYQLLRIILLHAKLTVGGAPLTEPDTNYAKDMALLGFLILLFLPVVRKHVGSSERHE